MNGYPFQDKHALVSGGTRGMGEAFVRSAAGWRR